MREGRERIFEAHPASVALHGSILPSSLLLNKEGVLLDEQHTFFEGGEAITSDSRRYGFRRHGSPIPHEDEPHLPKGCVRPCYSHSGY